jgi:hypothetical protein
MTTTHVLPSAAQNITYAVLFAIPLAGLALLYAFH